MALRPLLAATLVALALVAGCLDDQSGGTSLNSIPLGEAPSGDGAGTAGSHGNYARTESAVTVTKRGNEFVAEKTVTFSNDFGGAANADAKLSTSVGSVAFSDWSKGGYEVFAKLEGRGTTEQAARSNLDRLKVTHSDRLGAGRLTLDTSVQFPSNSNGLAGSLVAHLPASPAYRLTGMSNTGSATITGLGGPSASLTTHTGGVQVSGAFNTANLQTDTGGVSFDGIFNVVKGSTDTGGITARIEPTASGSIDLRTDTGGIELRLTQGPGYDADASTGTGSATIQLGSTTNVGTQSREHKHVQTAGYAQASIQVMVKAATDVGGVSIHY